MTNQEFRMRNCRYLFDGLLNLGSTLLGAWQSKKQQQREFDQQNQLLDKQNEFTEEMWNKQNAYNTPEAQMERMREAGINPNTAAGAIAGSGAGSADSVSSASAPSVNSAVPTVGSIWSNAATSAQEAMKRTSEINNINEDTANKKEDTLFKRIQNRWEDRIKNQTLENMKKDGLIKDENIQLLKTSNKYADREHEANLDILLQQKENMEKELEKIDAEKEKALQEINESVERIKLMGIEGENLKADTRYKDAMTQKAQIEKEFEEHRTDCFKAHNIDPLSDPIDAFLVNSSKEERQEFYKSAEEYEKRRARGRSEEGKQIEKEKTEQSWKRPIVKSSSRSNSVNLVAGSGVSNTSSDDYIVNPYKYK